MLDPKKLAGLGVRAGPASETAETAPEPDNTGLPPLEPGSVTAQALFQVWSGEQSVVLVDSPPGAGKTTAVSTVLAHLAQRSQLRIVAATNTRKQALSLAGRTAELLPKDKVFVKMGRIGDDAMPPSVTRGGPVEGKEAGTVTVRTLASCNFKRPECDVMVVDEAYQATFASLSIAAEKSDQVLMVGDPGQIGPVVASSTRAFHGLAMPPHHRAPEVFAGMDGTSVLNFDRSFRLGPETVQAIAPLYPFGFTSARPDRSIVGRSEIAAVRVSSATSVADPGVMTRLVDLASFHIGDDHLALDEHGEIVRYRLRPEDVAVVVSHNAQVTYVNAMMATRGIDGVTVGTADKLQGGQWHAVVALDPLMGYDEVSTHALSPGRLCVMSSRHSTCLTWVHDGSWADLLDDEDDEDQVLGRKVREALCDQPSR